VIYVGNGLITNTGKHHIKRTANMSADAVDGNSNLSAKLKARLPQYVPMFTLTASLTDEKWCSELLRKV
jgi:hypothetical protein